MPYEIKNYDGTILVELEDGVVDSGSSSLNFIGRNYSNFGTVQNENFLWLLQNFTGGSAPGSPIKVCCVDVPATAVTTDTELVALFLSTVSVATFKFNNAEGLSIETLLHSIRILVPVEIL